MPATAIECTARILDPLHDGIPRTLIAGDGAFNFYSRLGVLSAAIAPTTLVDTSASGGYRVPNNKWVTFGMLHDGSAVHLFADGQEVRVQEAAVDVPGVGPAGVAIGNRPDANESIRGDIDEIKVWRRDPRALWREFAHRPIDQQTANCWHDFLQRIDELLRTHPECKEQLLSSFRNVLERRMRILGTHGPVARARAHHFYERYRVLWRKGEIDGASMAKLVTEWLAWSQSLGMDSANDSELRGLLAGTCFKLMAESSARIDCDKKFMGYLRLFAPQPRHSAPTSAV